MSHGHSHGHADGGHQGGGGNLFSPTNAKHFVSVIVSTVIFFYAFDFSSFLWATVGIVLWSTFTSFVVNVFVFRLPIPYWVAFARRFVSLSTLIYVLLVVIFGLNSMGPFKGNFIVHLDLKGAPPTVAYLVSVFPVFKKLGATGLLIEWEDTLPFKDELELLRSSKTYYTEDEVKEILRAAASSGLEVIPLVQTFGHLEFVLKHHRFAPLREQQDDMGSICPSNPESLPLIKSIVDQVLEFHPSAKMIHLGGDEVWKLGSCKECFKKSKDALFTEHMLPILKHVKSKKVKGLIWDDMLRDFSVTALEDLKGYATPVIWQYQPDVLHGQHMNQYMWKNYHQVFKSAYAASCFKGATGPSQELTPIDYHMKNSISWAKVEQESILPFNGIILTGWSRYSHNDPLCEILPTGIPSLAVQLAILKKGSKDSYAIGKALNKIGLKGMPTDSTESIIEYSAKNKGTFPGSESYYILAQIEAKKDTASDGEIRQLISDFANSLHEVLHSADIADLRAQLTSSVKAPPKGAHLG